MHRERERGAHIYIYIYREREMHSIYIYIYIHTHIHINTYTPGGCRGDARRGLLVPQGSRAPCGAISMFSEPVYVTDSIGIS